MLYEMAEGPISYCLKWLFWG